MGLDLSDIDMLPLILLIGSQCERIYMPPLLGDGS